jgi:hypothetical protein
MMNWGFDLQGANRNRQGQNSFGTQLDDVAEKVGGLISLFIREALSNSADQRLENSTHPAKIFIDVISITKDTKKNFKKAFGWVDLEKHIAAAAGTGTNDPTAYDLSEARKNLNDDDSPTILVRISDYNSYGLCGPEDDHGDEVTQALSDSQRKNFQLFAKSTFITSSEAGRQGSFGLGKGVLYHLSSLKTVLMSSTILGSDGEHQIRTFGRTELPFHRCDDESWDGPGFFGSADQDHLGRNRIISSYDNNHSALENLFLDRDPSLGTGTTATSIAFKAKDERHKSNPEDLIAYFEKAVKKWFWPALSADKAPIEVTVRNFENKTLLSEKRIKPGLEYEGFINSFKGNSNATSLVEVGNIVKKDLEWDIPAKKLEFGNNPGFKGKGAVQIQLSDVVNSELKNKIALIRDNLCVVQYEDIKLHSDSSYFFYGTFSAGKARGNEEEDIRFFEFLRDAEPPLHDHWKYKTKIEMAYRIERVSSLLRSIHNDILDAAANIADIAAASNAVDYSHLEALFDLGKEGPSEGDRGISFKQFGEKLSGNQVSTKASIKNLDDAEIWGAKIIFSIDEVSKREHDLALEQILIEGDASNVEVHIEDGTGFLSVKGQAEIIVYVIAQINSPMTLAKARELTYSLTIFSRS